MNRPVIALVGDVVASRAAADQRTLLRSVTAALDRAAAAVPALQSPALTIGDEFQALYPDLATAVDGWLRLRCELGRGSPPVDVRVGLGRGTVEDTGAAPAPAGQSGTAWWHARDALDAARDLERRSHWPRSVRTRYVGDDERAGAVNAVLLLADQLLAGMDAGDLAILAGLRDGRRQADVADELGISQSAVARREGDRGISAVHRAVEELRGRRT